MDHPDLIELVARAQPDGPKSKTFEAPARLMIAERGAGVDEMQRAASSSFL
jgi:hypothetical protein